MRESRSSSGANISWENNFASINYEYFEARNLSSAPARKHLQKLEASWRQGGRLVHCDPFREGIWLFQNASNNISNPLAKDTDSLSVDLQDYGLLQKDKGTYEPASLTRSKQIVQNTITTPSSSSSPSSSLEAALRNAQALNARSAQANGALSTTQEPSTPSPGVKSWTSQDITSSLRDIHECFISAVLGSIVYFLCRNQGFIPLNSRTLILTSPKPTFIGFSSTRNSEMVNTIELATLDISLTSLGALVVKGHADMAPGLQSLINVPGYGGIDNLAPGAALWLAPGGNAAKFYSVSDEKNLPGSLSTSQLQANKADQRPNSFNSLAIKSWQSKCLEWLSAKGLDSAALESGGWLFVQVLGGPSPYSNTDFQGIPILEELAIVPWPARLCFQTSSTTIRDLQTPDTGINGPRDPLSFAQDWFTSKDERANIATKRQKERQAAETLSREQADLEARALRSNTYSPAALRRGSNAGAMYPTPPDAPHHPIGATPSFDGTASTPGNPNMFVPHEVPTSQATHALADADGDMWGSGKKERTSLSMHFNDNDNDNDNLFGEIEADIFGTDITDADFSFFDEPDNVQLSQKPSSPRPVFPPVNQEANSLGETPAPTSESINPPDHSDTNMLDGQDDNEHFRQGDSAPGSGPAESIRNDQMPAEQLPQAPVDLPFNKEAVFKRLFQDSSRPQSSSQPRRASLFDKVNFEESLLSVNDKYGARGQFKYSVQSGKLQKVDSNILARQRKVQHHGQELSTLGRILNDGNSAGQIQPNEPMDFLLDSDGASQISEQDNTSRSADDLSQLSKFGIKRKWEDEEGDEITSSFDGLAMDLEHSASTPHSISGSQMPLLDADPADWSLTTYFALPEPDVQSNALSDLELIASAQILADQAATGTLQVSRTTGNHTPLAENKASTTKELMNNLTKAMNFCLKDVATCTMRSFLEIPGIPVLNQNLRLPPRPMPNPRGSSTLDASRPNNPFPIAPPQLELRRSESKLSVLPTAVNFWENLGLGPSNCPKDISAVCVHPNFEGVAANCSTFLDQMRSVYESSRFGSHDRLAFKDVPDGLLPFAVDPQQHSKSHHLASLKDTTARLSRILSAIPAGEKNFVVYFVYPVDNSALLVHICSAFHHLFNLYNKALSDRRMNGANELVLQLIPLDFIASPSSLAVPLPSEYFRLALEVYDRCIDFTSPVSSPAIMLEQPLPKTIDFKLNANPSASLLQENTCLHVAYAQSIDDRWITAAWTDNRGTQQMTASYCLGRKNEPISMPFSEVANEIWETTLEYISSKKIHWRIMIARVGVMDPSESDFWMGLASTVSDAQVSLTLITVQPDPSLRLLPTSVVLSPNGNVAQSVITPVSTPQALQTSIVSPENATTPARDTTSAATPVEAPAEPDSDGRLIDFTDQSWGAVLAHRLNNSNSLMELNPALISGYLIKRGGTNSDDPPVVMEVNIVHSEVIGNPRTFHEGLLREILGYYRGLGTLARVRGIVDAVKDVRPWHIAAAEKAVKTLYTLM
jgi:mediator of RNA polymerase II transcription subunit 13